MGFRRHHFDSLLSLTSEERWEFSVGCLMRGRNAIEISQVVFIMCAIKREQDLAAAADADSGFLLEDGKETLWI
jgi:hypothetical protein